jgi:hypothetical protein
MKVQTFRSSPERPGHLEADISSCRFLTPLKNLQLADRFRNKFKGGSPYSGHLWQGRPYLCLLDEARRWAAIRYVERNPVAP